MLRTWDAQTLLFREIQTGLKGKELKGNSLTHPVADQIEILDKCLMKTMRYKKKKEKNHMVELKHTAEGKKNIRGKLVYKKTITQGIKVSCIHFVIEEHTMIENSAQQKRT